LTGFPPTDGLDVILQPASGLACRYARPAADESMVVSAARIAEARQREVVMVLT
jgi:hypothetical protein